MKNTKLSKKLNKFKSSPLIVAVAIVEVILLVCVSTFAWFTFSKTTTITTDVLSVEPDSGLDIDFNVADKDSIIHINKYISNFVFEPVTSLDGRNIFVPTTGSKDNTATSNMKFREATVNDMNSKYVNIDFTLTNTDETETKDVWFNSESYFKVNNESRTGKALRLAFYSNDGANGDVTSDMLEGGGSATVPDQGGSGGDDSSKYMVYFDKTGTFTYENDNEYSDPKKIWDTVYIEADFLANYPKANNKRMEMERIGDTNIYCLDLKPVLEYNSSADFSFVKFRSSANKDHTWNMTTQTGKIQNGYIYKPAKKTQNDEFGYIDTVNSHTGIVLAEPEENKVDPDEDDDITTDTPVDGSTEFVTVYYYNKLGWKTPYAYVYKDDSDKLKSWPGVPMTKVAGDIYYITFNKKYTNIIFNDGNGKTTPWEQTEPTTVDAGCIYFATTFSRIDGDGTFYDVDKEKYLSGNNGVTYPVISPGAPAGFKQPYAPVLSIDNQDGEATSVIPAFASSFEEYSYGSEKKLFSIAPKQTINLSMIIWLEGTDDDCINEHYLGKYIDLKLIFATKQFPENMYTYKFLDKTKETWLSHNITIEETKVTFKPVIQLYDNTANRGYLMKEVKDSEGNIIEYKVNAPQDVSEHDISFRRVNPLDATEAWNYWDAGVPTSYAFSESDTTDDKDFDTVTFSAFADGAPVTAKKADGTTYSSAPDKSCGGLWGDYETTLITLYDGTQGQSLFKSDNNKNKTAMTINYTYAGSYIEYKASSQDNDKYIFVVPTEICSKNSDTTIKVKKYYNFDDKYAINSDKNDMYHKKTWTVGSCSGSYLQICDDNDNTAYWGSDLVYFQAKSNIENAFKSYYVQAHFYSSSKHFYKPLQRNDRYNASGDGIAYACVVPNDNAYTHYQVQLCAAGDDTHSKILAETKGSEKNKITQLDSNEFARLNEVDNNICTVDNLISRLYVKCHNNKSGTKFSIYLWDSNNNAKTKWPGDAMDHSGPEGDYQYYYFDYDYNKYPNTILNNTEKNFQTGDITIIKPFIFYQIDNNGTLTTLDSLISDDCKNRLYCEFYNNDKW